GITNCAQQSRPRLYDRTMLILLILLIFSIDLAGNVAMDHNPSVDRQSMHFLSRSMSSMSAGPSMGFPLRAIFDHEGLRRIKRTRRAHRLLPRPQYFCGTTELLAKISRIPECDGRTS
ncbi:uncharacterized protein BJ212DRAFT_1398820, partial [Suillus subaureus]